MSRKSRIAGVFGLLFLLGAFTTGCDMMSSENEGRVRVLLTDAPFPFDLVAEVNVTITGLDLVGDEGTFELSDEEQSFNLLDLQDGVTALLADAEVPEGDYSQFRIRVEDAEIVLNDGSTHDLQIPSGRIKVLLPDSFFVSETDSASTITLDFDVSESFIVKGNPDTPAGIKGFLFKPVIKPINYHGHDDDDDHEPALQLLLGDVEEIGTDYLVVGGVRFSVGSYTHFEGFDTLAALVLGQEVKVKFAVTDAGYRALEIERE